MEKNTNKNFENYFIIFLIILVTLPILAPILSSIGLSSISKYIYFIYSFSCHQFHSRSLHIHDHQLAWCARDTGIWIGVLLATVFYKFKLFKKVNFWIFLLFVIPIAFDGGIQTLFTFFKTNGDVIAEEGVYLSNNFTRFATGFIFGTGVGLFITPQIITIQSDKVINFLKKHKIKPINMYFRLVIHFGIMLLIYLSFIQVWSATSISYKPTNVLDSVPKKQGYPYFYRRKNGECPIVIETIDDFFYIC